MSKFKYKITEQDKGFKVGDEEEGAGIRTTVTDVNPQTGQVEWDVEYTPDFEKLIDDSNSLYDSTYIVSKNMKGDDNLDDIFQEARELKNKIRAHIRREYPEVYRRIRRKEINEDMSLTLTNSDVQNLSDEEVDEKITSLIKIQDRSSRENLLLSKLVKYKNRSKTNEATVPNIGTPITSLLGATFGKKGGAEFLKIIKKDPKKYANIMKGINLDKLDDKAKSNLLGRIKSEFGSIYSKYKGQVEKAIPTFDKKKLRNEMSVTGGGVAGASFDSGVGGQYATPYAFNRNKKALGTDDDNYLKLGFKLAPNQVTENKDPGATLGPGPKAGPTGVKDNYYVKAFGYKLVPDKIKGSGVEVKHLWGKN